ncbi:DedA family protein [Streptomyces sp. NPDC058985]|uniref:DedA family protein n=1 Tax=Streptomyces sp. NPDC058985 TaxID=3346684 RepID=UPI00369414F5
MTLAHHAAPPLPLAVNVVDAQSPIAAFATIRKAVVMSAETGLLIDSFLPGDSPLFTAGLLYFKDSAATAGPLPIPGALVASTTSTLAGAQTSHLLGGSAGPALLARTKPGMIRDGAERVAHTPKRYRHAKVIIRAPSLPPVRTALDPLAEALAVPARTFTLWYVLGGLVLTAGLMPAGYDGLSASAPDSDRHLLPIIAVFVLVSLIPIALELLCSRRARPADGDGA